MSKVYLLNVDYFYENIDENDYDTEVYLSLEKAVEEGKYFLSKHKDDEGFRDYSFTVTETDPDYASKFDAEDLGINIIKKEKFGKYEPTHIIYYYDIDGNFLYKYLEYRDNQRKHHCSFKVFPEDKEDAGQKFKIGDIVRVKPVDKEEYYCSAYLDYWKPDKLYIVRGLPRKSEGQKYFDNTYALISNYNEDEHIKGLYTWEFYERDIEKYDGVVKEDSYIRFLQKIIKNEIAVSKDTWTKLKIGEILFDEKGKYKELPEYKEWDK